MTLADQILNIRERRLGLTQKELGEALDVGQVTISRWERGIVEPRPRHLRRLAALAEMPVSDFFDEPEKVA